MNSSKDREFFSIQYFLNGEENAILSALDRYAQNLTDLSDVNCVLELHNIKCLFDKKGNVFQWSSENYDRYKTSVNNILTVVSSFFDSVNGDNIVSVYSSCSVRLWDSFWEFFYKLKVYERIPHERFDEIISGLKMSPERLLENKEFAFYFEKEIVSKLKEPDFGARFLVSYYMRKQDKKRSYYLPKSLSPQDAYKTVSAYIDGDIVNANILTLIVNGKTSDGKRMPVDDRLRYKAKTRLEKFIKDNLNSMITKECGAEVSFSPNEDFMHIESMENRITAIYSSNWVEKNLDYPTLLNNFIFLFGYTDLSMRCSLVPVPNKRGTFEDISFVNGNGMYFDDHRFKMLNTLANSQMACYMRILADNDIYLEDACKWFFEDYLREEFQVEGFKSSFPRHDDTLVNKCKLLSSAMEGVLKQYRLLVEDGEINRELYEMSSSQINYKELPSFCNEKYAYIDDDELMHAIKVLFDNNTSWIRVISNDERYEMLTKILSGEMNANEIFSEKESEDIEWLLANGYLKKEGRIQPNYELIDILLQFYEKNYICLQYYNSQELMRLIAEGKVRVTNTLLSEPEAEYVDYILNNKEFSNGLALRNKYIHDSIPESEERQYRDYIILMKVMIILIIKVNEEFCLRDKFLDSKVES